MRQFRADFIRTPGDDNLLSEKEQAELALIVSAGIIRLADKGYIKAALLNMLFDLAAKRTKLAPQDLADLLTEIYDDNPDRREEIASLMSGDASVDDSRGGNPEESYHPQFGYGLGEDSDESRRGRLNIEPVPGTAELMHIEKMAGPFVRDFFEAVSQKIQAEDRRQFLSRIPAEGEQPLMRRNRISIVKPLLDKLGYTLRKNDQQPMLIDLVRKGDNEFVSPLRSPSYTGAYDPRLPPPNVAPAGDDDTDQFVQDVLAWMDEVENHEEEEVMEGHSGQDPSSGSGDVHPRFHAIRDFAGSLLANLANDGLLYVDDIDHLNERARTDGAQEVSKDEVNGMLQRARERADDPVAFDKAMVPYRDRIEAEGLTFPGEEEPMTFRSAAQLLGPAEDDDIHVETPETSEEEPEDELILEDRAPSSSRSRGLVHTLDEVEGSRSGESHPRFTEQAPSSSDSQGLVHSMEGLGASRPDESHPRFRDKASDSKVEEGSRSDESHPLLRDRADESRKAAVEAIPPLAVDTSDRPSRAMRASKAPPLPSFGESSLSAALPTSPVRPTSDRHRKVEVEEKAEPPVTAGMPKSMTTRFTRPDALVGEDARRPPSDDELNGNRVSAEPAPSPERTRGQRISAFLKWSVLLLVILALIVHVILTHYIGREPRLPGEWSVAGLTSAVTPEVKPPAPVELPSQTWDSGPVTLVTPAEIKALKDEFDVLLFVQSSLQQRLRFPDSIDAMDVTVFKRRGCERAFVERFASEVLPSGKLRFHLAIVLPLDGKIDGQDFDASKLHIFPFLRGE